MAHAFGVFVWGGLLLLAQSRFRSVERTFGQRLILWGFGTGLAGELVSLASAVSPVDGAHLLRPVAHVVEVWLQYVAIFILIAGFLSFLSKNTSLAANYLRFALATHTLIFLGALVVLFQSPGPTTVFGLPKPVIAAILVMAGLTLLVAGAGFVVRYVAGRQRWVLLTAIGFFASGGLVRLLALPSLPHLIRPPGDLLYASMASAIGAGLLGYLCIVNHSEGEAVDQQVRERTADLEATLEELAIANSKLVEQSTMDGLTGVRNRRYFDEALCDEWARASREGRPLAVALVDLDRFKDINDLHGHPKGDECLVSVGSILQGRTRRPADVVARYGGDEFAVLLPNTDEAGAQEVLNKARHETEQLANGLGVTLTISVGIAACIPADDALPEDLIKRADECLYVAKQGGRNHVSSSLGPDAPELSGLSSEVVT